MTDSDVLRDLLFRTMRASDSLDKLAQGSAVRTSERQRIEAKASGVRLVAGYIREAIEASS